MMKILYQKLLKPVLFLFSPDSVHKWFVWIGRVLIFLGPLRGVLRFLYGTPKGPDIVVDGLTYKGPVLLAAGFDYNGHLAPVLWDIGFAGQEVGSVTGQKCLGNTPPNLTRLVKSKSIQVYKGLRNDGVDEIIPRLKASKAPKDFVLGVSIARTNSETCSTEQAGIDDYVYSYRRLNQEGVGDFYTINISCPNAFGGEDFACAEPLKRLLKGLKEIPSSKPLYFKMPINKPWDDFSALLDILVEYGVNGVVIGNLNKNYDEIDHPDELSSQYRGGLSGLPCKKRSNELIEKTRQKCPDLTIIGCGGVMVAEDAMEKLRLGANLVQMISGMIFNGPHLVNEINKLAREEK